MNFDDNLAFGHAGERVVEAWLRRGGWWTIPGYAYTDGERAAPALNGQGGAHVLPDLDVAQAGRRVWVEVKTYHGPADNRRLRAKVHGVSRRLFEHYRRVGEITGAPVFVFVLEIDSGELLSARLDSIETFGCMCAGCACGGTCRAPIKRGVYWRRSDMFRCGSLCGDPAFEALRGAHTEMFA